jgi:hypothetical protein
MLFLLLCFALMVMKVVMIRKPNEIYLLGHKYVFHSELLV